MGKILVINIIPSGVGGIQTYGKTLEEKLKKLGICTERIETYKVDATASFPVEVSKKIIRFFRNLIKLFKIITQNRNRRKMIIHAHIAIRISFWENSVYAFFGYIAGVPFVFHIHSSLLHTEYLNSNCIGKMIRKYVLNRSLRIIALSDYWRKKLLEMKGVLEEKFITIYNFIDVSKFNKYDQENCRKMLDLPKNKKIIFSVGRLTERKGYQYLIEAIPEIMESRNDFLFIIGGKGPLKEKLEGKIKNLEINENIRLEGFIQEDMLPMWLNAADIFVLPSLRETFPIVMLEALASGKPVIGTKIAAMPEIIYSEDYGLLVEPANSGDLAKKILIALDKEWNNEMIGKYAEHFTWQNVEKKLLGIYKES